MGSFEVSKGQGVILVQYIHKCAKKDSPSKNLGSRGATVSVRAPCAKVPWYETGTIYFYFYINTLYHKFLDYLELGVFIEKYIFEIPTCPKRYSEIRFCFKEI